MFYACRTTHSTPLHAGSIPAISTLKKIKAPQQGCFYFFQLCVIRSKALARFATGIEKSEHIAHSAASTMRRLYRSCKLQFPPSPPIKNTHSKVGIFYWWLIRSKPTTWLAAGIEEVEYIFEEPLLRKNTKPVQVL